MRLFSTFNIFWIPFVIVSTSRLEALSSDDVLSNACDKELATKLATQIQRLEANVDDIQKILLGKSIQPRSSEFWEGNQSTFSSFRRLSDEEKSKLTSFKLMDMQDLDVSTLLQELRPCTNLGSVKLHQVELLGRFPNTSAGRVALPKLYELELILSQYADTGRKEIIPAVILFKKDHNAKDELTLNELFEQNLDLNIQFRGFTKIVIDHDFSELIMDVGLHSSNILSAINPEVFKLKRLTLSSSSLNISQVPTDLSYLNLKYVSVEGKFRPTIEFNLLVKRLRRLKSLHIDAENDLNRGAEINMSDLSFDIQRISLRGLRINMTDKPLLPSLESILLDVCLIDDRIVETIERSFYNLRKVAILFDGDRQSTMQCHPFLYNVVRTVIYWRSTIYLKKLESIFITRCQRVFGTALKPDHFAEIEEFLTNMGLGKSQNFLLEKKQVKADEWVWIGKNVTEVDVKFVKYHFSDWHKLRSWENYSS